MRSRSRDDVSKSIAIEALTLAFNIDQEEKFDPTIGPNYFIDPVHGNDSFTGTSATRVGNTLAGPFKTWKQMQAVLGTFTVVTVIQASVSAPNILTITILNDLLPTDPITFYNVLAGGAEAVIVGQNKVLVANKKITAIQVENPDTNTPWAITATGVTWANFIGKMVQFTTGVAAGNRAFVMADNGGGQALLSEIVQDASGGIALNGGLVIPPTTGNPAVNDHFEILDFTNVTVGPLFVGTDNSQTNAFSFPPTGLVLTRLHIGGNEFVTPATAGDPIFGVTDCIVDATTITKDLSENSSLYNVCHTANSNVIGNMNEVAGLYVNGSGVGIIGGTYFQDFNTIVYGNLGPNPSDGIYMNGGTAFIGPMGFFNTQDIMIGVTQGAVASSGFANGSSSFFLNTGFNPFWGSGNDSNIFIFPNSSVQICQNSPDGSFHPPTVTSTAPTLVAFGGLNGNFDQKACAIDVATQAPDVSAPGVLRDGTLANLVTAASAGGFVVDSTATTQNSNMTRLDWSSQLTWSAIHV